MVLMAVLYINLPGWSYVSIYKLVITGLLLRFRKQLANGNAVVACLFGFVCYMVSEYVMPAPRGAYTLAQWSFAVLLMLSTARLKPLDLLLVVTALCMMTAFPFHFPYFYELGEFLLVVQTLQYIRMCSENISVDGSAIVASVPSLPKLE